MLTRTATPAEHLTLYQHVDIALDPFPYQGTTTTFEALLMGVPVVTLEGRTHAQRVGTSILTNVGAPELIARSLEEYLSIAQRLAADRPRLNQYRQNLRAMLLRSTLCDQLAYGQRLGARCGACGVSTARADGASRLRAAAAKPTVNATKSSESTKPD